MARIRTIKPEFFTDEKLAECSIAARLLFIGLWVHADDAGRLFYSPKRLKMQVYACDDVDVAALVGELERQHLVLVYEVGGRSCLQVNNFLRHQKINNPSKPYVPTPIPLPESSDSPNEALLHGSGKGKGNGNGRGKGEEPAPSLTPTVVVPEDSGSPTRVPPGTPSDLHPLQYASRLLQEVGLPETKTNNAVVGAAIVALSKEGKGPAAAYEFLLAKAKDAQDEGVELTKFWFEDAGWRSNGGKHGKPSIGQIVERELAILRDKRAQ